MSAVDKIYKI